MQRKTYEKLYPHLTAHSLPALKHMIDILDDNNVCIEEYHPVISSARENGYQKGQMNV